jgi:hypothetical protein
MTLSQLLNVLHIMPPNGSQSDPEKIRICPAEVSANEAL